MPLFDDDIFTLFHKNWDASLSHSCVRVSLDFVVLIYATFDKNFRIKYDIEKYFGIVAE